MSDVPAGSWTSPADVLARLERRWSSGELLAAHASGQMWQPILIPLRGPGPRDLGERFNDVVGFVNSWERAVTSAPMRGRVELEFKNVGGRASGSNRLPAKLSILSFTDLCDVLGKDDVAHEYIEAYTYARDCEPRFATWMIERPKRALIHLPALRQLFDAAIWVKLASGSGAFLREIDVPGIDTKFIDAHRGIVGELVELILSPDRVDRTVPIDDFSRRFGLRGKPKYVRFRLLSPDPFVSGLSEITVRTSELTATSIGATRIFVIENESTYLAFPAVAQSVVIFGGGYAISTLSQLPWLASRELVYWGDIDTHGFAILNRLRLMFPHTRSMLMDRQTLLAHEAQWGREPSQTTAELAALDAAEGDLYRQLIDGTLGDHVRLEQERIDFSVVKSAIGSLKNQSATSTVMI